MLAVPTIHPAFLIRSADGSAGSAKFEDTVIQDLKRALEFTQRKPIWDESIIWKRDAKGRLVNLFPTLDECVEYFKNNYQKLNAVDIETTGEEPLDCQILCVGFASESGDAICVPILQPGGADYWSEDDKQTIWRMMGYFLASKSTPKVFQNGSFDTIVLGSWGLPVDGWDHDCYVEEETEFLTERGWLRYRQISAEDRLGTIDRYGRMEFQHFFQRLSKPYRGKVHVFETQTTRAVVTSNHRMWSAPLKRDNGTNGGKHCGEWGFRRADEMLGKSPDTYVVQKACAPDYNDDRKTYEVDGLILTERWARLIGLLITDGCFSRGKDCIRAGGFKISQKENGRASPALADIAAEIPLKKRVAHRDPNGFRKTEINEETWELNNADLARVLESWIGRYSVERRLPKFWGQLPYHLRAALLDGLILGDGAEVRGYQTFNSSNKLSADDVQALALSLGRSACVYKSGKLAPGVPCWQVSIADHGSHTTELIARERKSLPSKSKNGTDRYRGHVETKDFEGEIVCFSVPNETLITRSGSKAAFYGNTMAAHHVLDGELPHSLAYIGSRYTEVPYYKDEVKGDVRWIDKDAEVLRSYNIRDVLTTIRGLPPLLKELEHWELAKLYQDELRITKIFVKATLRGVLIDEQARSSEALACPINWKKLKKCKAEGKEYKTDPIPYGLAPQLVISRDRALAGLRAIAGHDEFNPASVQKQLKWFLFDLLKFPVTKKTKKGGASTDREAMILLALHAKPGTDQEKALKLLIEWRKSEKLLGTSIRGMPPHRVTGRLHASWKLLTVTGRLASSPNMQNWGPKVKRMVRAPWGRRLVGVDLSQAELRGISYFASDDEVLLMYEKDINIHTVNASLIFQVRNPGVNTNQNTEDYLREAVPRLLKDPKTGKPLNYDDFPVMSEKQWDRTRRLAKNFRFGWQYGAIAETIYTVLRSERDPDTNDPIFPDLDLRTIEVAKIQTEQLSKAVPRYWAAMNEHVEKIGYFRTPLSGRIRWFRAGKKSNDIVNFPIQSLVADWMNQRLLVIDERLERETGGDAVIVLQVHDSLVVDCAEEHVDVVKETLSQELAKTFKLRHYENAKLPPDKPSSAIWLDELK